MAIIGIDLGTTEYIKEAEKEFGGKWTGVLDTY